MQKLLIILLVLSLPLAFSQSLLLNEEGQKECRRRCGDWFSNLECFKAKCALLFDTEPTGKVVTSDPNCETKGVTGKLVIQGSKNAHTIKPGDRIEAPSDKWVTVLLFGNLIRIKGGSIMRLPCHEKEKEPEESATVRLVRGLYEFTVPPSQNKEDRFRAETNSVSTGVRGTRFVIETTGTRDIIAVQEGSVDVTSITDPKQQKVIEAGKQVRTTFTTIGELEDAQTFSVERVEITGDESVEGETSGYWIPILAGIILIAVVVWYRKRK